MDTLTQQDINYINKYTFFDDGDIDHEEMERQQDLAWVIDSERDE